MLDVSVDDSVRVESDGALVTLTLNDPSTLNSISLDMVESVIRVLDAVSAPGSGVRALLITGAGRAFSSGLNLKRRGEGRPDSPVPTIDTHFNPLIRRFRTVPVPIVAAVNGPCVGIGATMALVTDSIVAASSSYFYFPFVWQLGVLGDAGISWLLPRMVGWPRARRMLLQSERVSADVALDWGLVEAVWDDAEFVERAREHAQRLAGGPTVAMGRMRQMLWTAMENGFEDQLRWEVEHSVPLLQTDDCQEAFSAFSERRKPDFKGR